MGVWRFPHAFFVENGWICELAILRDLALWKDKSVLDWPRVL